MAMSGGPIVRNSNQASNVAGKGLQHKNAARKATYMWNVRMPSVVQFLFLLPRVLCRVDGHHTPWCGALVRLLRNHDRSLRFQQQVLAERQRLCDGGTPLQMRSCTCDDCRARYLSFVYACCRTRTIKKTLRCWATTTDGGAQAQCTKTGLFGPCD